MEPISGTIATVKSLLEIARGIQSMTEDMKVRGKVSELLDKINDLQIDALDSTERLRNLMDENRGLKEKINEYNDWDKRKADYAQFQLKSKSVVMIPKAGDGSSYQKVWYCANCFLKRELSPLQRNAPMAEAPFNCPNCKSTVILGMGEWNEFKV